VTAKDAVAKSVWGGFAVNDDLMATSRVLDSDSDSNSDSDKEDPQSTSIDTGIDTDSIQPRSWRQSARGQIPAQFSTAHRLQMQSLFRLRDPVGADGSHNYYKSSSRGKKSSRFGSLLDSKRVNNVGIGMRQFKDFASFAALIDAVTRLDTRLLPLARVRQLASLLPTEGEVRKLQRYRGTVSTLAPAEQLLWHLSCVPRCTQKVQAFLFVLELDTLVARQPLFF
jgi:hypothetical protein